MIKRLHIKAGAPWTSQHALAMTDARQACERGMGPADQVAPLPLEQVCKLSDAKLRGIRRMTWPAAGLDAAIVSCAWLLREIESSLALYKHVELFDPPAGGSGCGWARWSLPATKGDPKALGVARSLACACPGSLCPVAAMRRVRRASAERSWAKRRSVEDGPLLPRRDGHVLTKDQVIRFYRDMALAVGSEGRSGATPPVYQVLYVW